MKIIENIIKGPITTAIGLLVMAAAGYGWWTNHLTNWEGAGLAIIGFVLMEMRDEIPGWIRRFVNLVLNKFKNQPPLAVVLIVLLSLIALPAFSQTSGNFTSIRLNKSPRAADTTTYATNGMLYFNPTTQELRLRKDNVWGSLGGGGGSVAGTDRTIQYNNGGAFGAESGFEYNQSTNQLSIPVLGTISVGGGTQISGSAIGFIGPGNIFNVNGGDALVLQTIQGGGTITLTSDFLRISDSDVMGRAALVGGTVTVNNTRITANSNIILTIQTPGGTPGTVYVSARVANTSFTITSTSVTDTSTVAWVVINP